MSCRYSLVVFDWDGTIIDSTAAIAHAIQRAAADLGLPVPDNERASHVIGLGLRDALALAVPELRPEDAPAFSARYRHHYLAAEEELNLFPGAVDLVEELASHGAMLAVATGKSRAGLARALAASGLGPRFAATRCADQTHPKPHPAMLLELMEELDAIPESTVMVGDTTHDLRMAAAAGTHAVGVTYGAHPREQLAACAPAALVDDVAGLRRWLLPA